MSRVLVTGGSGFLGSALCRRLVADGHEVRSLDNDARGVRRGPVPGVEYEPIDVRKADGWHRSVAGFSEGCDAIWHLAAINGTRNFYERPADVLDVQIRGTLNVLDACKANGVKDLVLFSSSEVYATPTQIPTPESAALTIPDLTNPRYSYAGGKIAAELLCWHSPIERVRIVRPHNVYGPDMGFDHVIPELVMKIALAGSEPVKLASPWSTRAFCHVSDFIDGAMTVWKRAGGPRGVFHVGTEQETQIFDLAAMICQAMGRPEPEWERTEAPHGSPERRCPDTTRVRALGWRPRVPLADGLRETVATYMACRERWPA